MFFSDERQPDREQLFPDEDENGIRITHLTSFEGLVTGVDVNFLSDVEGITARVELRRAALRRVIEGATYNCIAIRCFYPNRGIRDAYAFYTRLPQNTWNSES